MQADSSNAEAVYVRGLCLYYNDNLEKGLIHFERALSLDPDNKNAREMRVKAKNLKEKKERGKLTESDLHNERWCVTVEKFNFFFPQAMNFLKLENCVMPKPSTPKRWLLTR